MPVSQKPRDSSNRPKQKDYYKVLAVSHDANPKTIKKAFRNGAKTAHPDKKGGSEANTTALHEVYEVLSNPELRARFDADDDLNDPTGGAGGGGNPFAFAHFFNAAGGGGGFPGGGFAGGGGEGGPGAFQSHFNSHGGRR